MKKKVIILVDAGYLKKAIQKSGYFTNTQGVVSIVKKCVVKDEELHKVLYYDCEPFNPSSSGQEISKIYINPTTKSPLVKQSNTLVKGLAQEDLFAVRLGKLKFRGWVSHKNTHKPNFQQKGVDMRIGLDIAHISHQNNIDRIILITGDTDFIPAMKYARKSNIQIVIIQFNKNHLSPELKNHTDFCRIVDVSTLGLEKYNKPNE